MIWAIRDSETISLRWSGSPGTSRRFRLPAQKSTGSAAGSMSTTTGRSSFGSFPTATALLQPLSMGKRHNLFIGRKKRRVSGLGCTRFLDVVVGVPRDFLFGFLFARLLLSSHCFDL